MLEEAHWERFVLVKYQIDQGKKVSFGLDFLALISARMNQISFFLWHFLLGFSIGFVNGANSAVILSFISEVAPIQFMGRFAGFSFFFINLSILVCAVLGFGLSENMGSWWRVMLGVQIFPPLLRLVYLLLVHKMESPRFYYMRGNKEMAKVALGIVYTEPHVEYQLNLLEEEKTTLQVTSDPSVYAMKGRVLLTMAMFFPADDRHQRVFSTLTSSSPRWLRAPPQPG
jgi:MFS family permease